MTPNSEEYIGEVAEIIYENEENSYKVLEIETDEIMFTAVGYIPYVAKGERIKISGKWITHSVYGEQFKIEVYEKCIPKSKDDILKYLSSGIIKGIKEATAKKIVEKFGEESLEILEKHPLKLAEIRGISANKAVSMNQSYIEQMASSMLIMFLQKYSVPVNLSIKIYKKFGADAIDFIKLNPYVLCDEIEGVGFKTADRIALEMGVDLKNTNRIKSGTLYVLRENTLFGHTYIPKNTLCNMASELLRVNTTDILIAIETLIYQGTFIGETVGAEERIYYFLYYNAEKYVARKLRIISHITFEENLSNLNREIKQIENEERIYLAENQKNAVINALTNSVSVITGGPGTGKTTVINTIIKIFKMRGLKVVLTAPTGRAAKRMSQICNMEAKTIHRLLGAGYEGDDEFLTFGVDEENPLSDDVIIVDEMSMVDIMLMQNLLKAVETGKRLILVGDSNQLPSVGAGNVLADIIKSEIVNVTYLTEIFRQAKQSMIVVNAHKINSGLMPVANGEDTDFFFANIPDAKRGSEYIISLCSQKLPQKYDVDKFDIQVLSPCKKGIAGIFNLNNILQEAINPYDAKKAQKEYGDIIFREGDKVMQNKNNYDIKWVDINTAEEGSGVFNGDVGYILSINHSFKTISVMMDDKCVKYDFNDLSELDLAYAITVHKSQGSEFKIVIIPVYDGPYMLINRNLFYTAVTRAKDVVVLVGSEAIIKKMVSNNKKMQRFSGLYEKLIGRSEDV